MADLNRSAVADKPIAAGDELLLDYGDDYRRTYMAESSPAQAGKDAGKVARAEAELSAGASASATASQPKVTRVWEGEFPILSVASRPVKQ